MDNIKSNYVGMKFYPRVLQEKEMNELLEMVHRQQKIINSLLYPDGTVIEGGLVSLEDRRFKAGEATIIIDGYYLTVPAKTAEFSQSSFDIGVRYRKRMVTANEDPDFRDSNKDSINFGNPGADRIYYEVEWATNEADIDPGYKFIPVRRCENTRLLPCKPRHTLNFLNSISYDAVVGEGGFDSLQAAIQHAGDGSKILVNSDIHLISPVWINHTNIEIHFERGANCTYTDKFEGSYMFEVAKGKHVLIRGGKFHFPRKGVRLLNVASPTVFVMEAYLLGANRPDEAEAMTGGKIFSLSE